jgi:hypothetical protein
MNRIHTQHLVLLAATVACGGAPSSAGTATTTPTASAEPTAASTESWGREEPAEQERKPAPCFARCAELIQKADDLFRQAGTEKDASRRPHAHAKAGEAYVGAWRGCSLETPGGEDLACEGAPRVVPRMLEAFRESDRPHRLIFATLVARDRRWRTESAPSDEDLTEATTRAENAHANKPDAPDARDMIRMASYGRIALGNASPATKDMALFAQGASKAEKEEHSAMRIALASKLNEATDHAAAQRVLGTTPPGPSSRLLPVWHAEVGRASAGQKREAAASQSFRKALDAWQAIPPADLRQRLGSAEPWPMVDRERMVEAVGAAQFFFAEQARAKADGMPFPKYKGPGTVTGVTDFVNTSIGPYIRDRQARLIEADDAYRKVSEIRPVAPARWVVASASRVGQMWAAFARDVADSPLPAPVAKDPDVEEGYRRTLRESMVPVVDKARRAFVICRDAADRSRVDDEFSRACSRWLTETPER